MLEDEHTPNFSFDVYVFSILSDDASRTAFQTFFSEVNLKGSTSESTIWELCLTVPMRTKVLSLFVS